MQSYYILFSTFRVEGRTVLFQLSRISAVDAFSLPRFE
jgi:hypothetical protein